MEGNLTEEQQETLNDDAINRQPIGSDEILLVGDIRLGIPVLKRHLDGQHGPMALRQALETDCQICAKFRAWTRTGSAESFKTLMEVQLLRELVRESESAVIDS